MPCSMEENESRRKKHTNYIKKYISNTEENREKKKWTNIQRQIKKGQTTEQINECVDGEESRQKKAWWKHLVNRIENNERKWSICKSSMEKIFIN